MATLSAGPLPGPSVEKVPLERQTSMDQATLDTTVSTSFDELPTPPRTQYVSHDVNICILGMAGIIAERYNCRGVTESSTAPPAPSDVKAIVSLREVGSSSPATILTSQLSDLLKKSSAEEEVAFGKPGLQSIDSLGSMAPTSRFMALWNPGKALAGSPLSFETKLQVDGDGNVVNKNFELTVALCDSTCPYDDMAAVPIGSAVLGVSGSGSSLIQDLAVENVKVSDSHQVYYVRNPDAATNMANFREASQIPKPSPPKLMNKKQKAPFRLFKRRSQRQNSREEDEEKKEDPLSQQPMELPPRGPPDFASAYSVDSTGDAMLRVEVDWKQRDQDLEKNLESALSRGKGLIHARNSGKKIDPLPPPKAASSKPMAPDFNRTPASNEPTPYEEQPSYFGSMFEANWGFGFSAPNEEPSATGEKVDESKGPRSQNSAFQTGTKASPEHSTLDGAVEQILSWDVEPAKKSEMDSNEGQVGKQTGDGPAHSSSETETRRMPQTSQFDHSESRASDSPIEAVTSWDDKSSKSGMSSKGYKGTKSAQSARNFVNNGSSLARRRARRESRLSKQSPTIDEQDQLSEGIEKVLSWDSQRSGGLPTDEPKPAPDFNGTKGAGDDDATKEGLKIEEDIVSVDTSRKEKKTRRERLKEAQISKQSPGIEHAMSSEGIEKVLSWDKQPNEAPATEHAKEHAVSSEGVEKVLSWDNQHREAPATDNPLHEAPAAEDNPDLVEPENDNDKLDVKPEEEEVISRNTKEEEVSKNLPRTSDEGRDSSSNISSTKPEDCVTGVIQQAASGFNEGTELMQPSPSSDSKTQSGTSADNTPATTLNNEAAETNETVPIPPPPPPPLQVPPPPPQVPPPAAPALTDRVRSMNSMSMQSQSLRGEEILSLVGSEMGQPIVDSIEYTASQVDISFTRSESLVSSHVGRNSDADLQPVSGAVETNDPPESVISSQAQSVSASFVSTDASRNVSEVSGPSLPGKIKAAASGVFNRGKKKNAKANDPPQVLPRDVCSPILERPNTPQSSATNPERAKTPQTPASMKSIDVSLARNGSTVKSVKSVDHSLARGGSTVKHSNFNDLNDDSEESQKDFTALLENSSAIEEEASDISSMFSRGYHSKNDKPTAKGGLFACGRMLDYIQEDDDLTWRDGDGSTIVTRTTVATRELNRPALRSIRSPADIVRYCGTNQMADLGEAVMDETKDLKSWWKRGGEVSVTDTDTANYTTSVVESFDLMDHDLRKSILDKKTIDEKKAKSSKQAARNKETLKAKAPATWSQMFYGVITCQTHIDLDQRSAVEIDEVELFDDSSIGALTMTTHEMEVNSDDRKNWTTDEETDDDDLHKLEMDGQSHSGSDASRENSMLSELDNNPHVKALVEGAGIENGFEADEFLKSAVDDPAA